MTGNHYAQGEPAPQRCNYLRRVATLLHLSVKPVIFILPSADCANRKTNCPDFRAN